jgi:hypothetical protein
MDYVIISKDIVWKVSKNAVVRRVGIVRNPGLPGFRIADGLTDISMIQAAAAGGLKCQQS